MIFVKSESSYICPMKNIHSEKFKIGILGGGQLGRMTLQKAYDLNLHISILDPSENAPCKNLASEFVVGDFKDFEQVYSFGKSMDVLSIEFEDVNADALQKLQDEGVKVFPQASVLKIIQDKALQKEFYRKNNFPTSEFQVISTKEEIQHTSLHFPLFQKLRTSGYDGYGVQKIMSANDLENAFDAPSVIEEAVDLEKELSVIVARNENGDIESFPLVELHFNAEANMVDMLFSPANVSRSVAETADKLAKDLIVELNMVGILAVEMFLKKNGKLLINEIAPRAHNSGHHSIEGNYTSQFEQHLRSILNLPLGSTKSIAPAVMINLLGEKDANGTAVYHGMKEALGMHAVYPHLYGKEMVKPFRKMGHITILDQNLEKAKEKAQKLKKLVKITASI